MKPKEKRYVSPDKFDRILGELTGLPDVARSKPSNVVAVLPVIGQAQTWVIHTMRQREKGDYIFVQYIDDTGSVRLVIPPEAADAIARQRDALTTKNRKRAAKATADARKARGEPPAFLKARR